MAGAPAARTRGMTTLRDLPLDTLSLILSLIPFEERFQHPRWACWELAAASVPPTIAWSDIDLNSDFARLPHVRSAIERAAPAVRRVCLCKPEGWAGDGPPPDVPAMDRVAPYMQELVVLHPDLHCPYDWCSIDAYEAVAHWLAPRLGAAARLTRLELNTLISAEMSYTVITIVGPPGLIASGCDAFQEFLLAAVDATPDEEPWRIYSAMQSLTAGDTSPLLALHRGLSAAAAATRRPVRLSQLGPVYLDGPVDGILSAAHLLEEMGEGSLTSLGLTLPGLDEDEVQRDIDASARLVRVIDALPCMQELFVHWDSSPVDLTGVRRAFHLTKLCFHFDCFVGDVTIPPAIAARLESLTIVHDVMSDPPPCLAAPGCAFTRLTRLEYGDRDGYDKSINLAPWSDARFRLPCLVEMHLSVTEWGVTLDGGQTGPAWAVAVATKTLPRLALLELHPQRRYNSRRDLVDYTGPPGGLFACRTARFEDEPRRKWWNCKCMGCGAPQVCLGADAVYDTVMHGLPAAAAAAGRSLVVRVHDVLHVPYEPLDECDRLLSRNKLLVLKYESLPGPAREAGT